MSSSRPAPLLQESYLLRRKTSPLPVDMTLSVSMETYRKKYKALLYHEEEVHVEVLKTKFV